MPGGGQSFWTRNAVLHLRETLLQRMLPLKRRLKPETRNQWSVTNVTATSILKMVWRYTLANPTRKCTQSKQHLIAQDNSKGTPQVTLQFSWQTYWITKDWNNFIFVIVKSWLLLWYFLFAIISATTADNAHEVYHLWLSLKYTVNI